MELIKTISLFLFFFFLEKCKPCKLCEENDLQDGNKTHVEPNHSNPLLITFLQQHGQLCLILFLTELSQKKKKPACNHAINNERYAKPKTSGTLPDTKKPE